MNSIEVIWERKARKESAFYNHAFSYHLPTDLKLPRLEITTLLKIRPQLPVNHYIGAFSINSVNQINTDINRAAAG